MGKSEKPATFKPKIYVACLAAYNSGTLHGEWIDADQHSEDICAEIKSMLDASPVPDAEEWAIHDHEDFGGLEIDEHEAIGTVAVVARLVKRHGEPFVAWAKDRGISSDWTDDDEIETSFLEAYQGCYQSMAEYVEELLEEVVDKLPKEYRHYFDYEKYGRDQCLTGYYWTADASGGGVHIFASR